MALPPRKSFLELLAVDIQQSNTSLTLEQIKSFLNACKVWQYEWGAIMALENDMHIHIFKHYRKKVYLRKPLKEVAFFMFKNYPVIKTSILKNKGNEVLEFDLRIGWKLYDETETTWYLQMKQEDFKYV